MSFNSVDVKVLEGHEHLLGPALSDVQLIILEERVRLWCLLALLSRAGFFFSLLLFVLWLLLTVLGSDSYEDVENDSEVFDGDGALFFAVKEGPKLLELLVVVGLLDDVAGEEGELLEDYHKLLVVEASLVLLVVLALRYDVLNDLVELFVEFLGHVGVHLLVDVLGVGGHAAGAVVLLHLLLELLVPALGVAVEGVD